MNDRRRLTPERATDLPQGKFRNWNHCWLRFRRHEFSPYAPILPGHATQARFCRNCGWMYHKLRFVL
jgi:hypothetical protein